MKRVTVRVRWPHGLHLRPAAALVRIGQRFRSTILFHAGRRRADIRSVISLIGLCAVMGTTIDIEASGDDEDSAIQAIEQAFSSDDGDAPQTGGYSQHS